MSEAALRKILIYHQTNSRSELLNLLVLAARAEEDGTCADFTTKKLMEVLLYTTERGVHKAIQTLLNSGQIIRHEHKKGPGFVHKIDLVFGDGSNWNIIANRCQRFRTPLPPHPAGE
jgi:hypothetical protein